VKKIKYNFQVTERILCCKEMYRERENSMPKLCEVIGDQNEDLFLRNCMSEMRPCSTADRQISLTEVRNEAHPLKYSEEKLLQITSYFFFRIFVSLL
jgi:hypothetical protein